MLKARKNLPDLLQNNSIGIELGVAAASYTKVLYDSKKFKTLYGIDMWNSRGHTDDEMKWAKKLVPNVKIMHGTFEQFVNKFEDNFFDFIYIDGYAHTGQDDGKTLYDWWPKLKVGGIFSGHDYCKQYGETIKRVDAFYNKNIDNIVPWSLNVTNDVDNFPSWYFYKR